LIEARAGRLAAIRLRPWPKIISALEIEWWGHWQHATRSEDVCFLYYNQPWRFPNFLAVKYAVSGRRCSLATMHRVLEALDEVARIKGTDALLCDVWNSRIHERMLARHGWEPQRRSRWHRNYIKRFYGHYPPRPASVTGTASQVVLSRPESCRASA
jgi:hypothetical protein